MLYRRARELQSASHAPSNVLPCASVDFDHSESNGSNGIMWIMSCVRSRCTIRYQFHRFESISINSLQFCHFALSQTSNSWRMQNPSVKSRYITAKLAIHGSINDTLIRRETSYTIYTDTFRLHSSAGAYALLQGSSEL